MLRLWQVQINPERWPEASNLGKALCDKDNSSVTSLCRSALESPQSWASRHSRGPLQSPRIIDPTDKVPTPKQSLCPRPELQRMKASTAHGDMSSLGLCTRGKSLDENSCSRWGRICNKPFHQASKPQESPKPQT